MKYTNEICQGCGRKFTDEDDIVTCPECGTPQHRECWLKEHKCVNEHLHGEDFEWRPKHAPEKEEEAVKAQESARALFSGAGTLEMPTAEITEDMLLDGKIDILGILAQSGLCGSRSEARRAVEQGGVSVDDEKVTDIKTCYTPEQLSGDGIVVRRGKKSYKRVKMA